ncbi:peptide chain release factor 2 [Pseudothermotoga thermarum]|uniref:Peptide chain release factor 2 n=1 Tax=Pseudothermotoga thermarum DSM 5069 TaxID=688269 RepID=F7YYT3_9THEM|nr:peptide chain release factor 2 [Pseudothermotoga thermarum]AEH51121.1 bacterial peptide chain release factor 2 (bRF-2) [Pseudothermotoga thermarum DSM 5069]
MIAYETKVKIEELKTKAKNLKQLVEPEKLQMEIQQMESKLASPDIWNDQKSASEIGKKLRRAKKLLEDVTKIDRILEEIEIGLELSDEDPEFVQDVERRVTNLEKIVKQFQLDLILNDPMDQNNAYLSVHPGAGGTESHDWAQMLLRMYMRWAEKKGFEVELVDFQPGEEAGVKSATLLIKGEYAYGYLKHERGVHRLVRISPFDAAGRRHTSFASVNVIPELSDDIEIEIRPEDLKIETFRASGHGGQYVNKTDSAVRITHIPTGIVVSCQSERSQHQNKAQALKMLKARLYQLEMLKRKEKIEELQGELKEIAWGNQIRSYILHPYKLVKDHRTEVETGDAEAVLDGEIDLFIEAELFYFAEVKL